jgi:hypothetical protein
MKRDQGQERYVNIDLLPKLTFPVFFRFDLLLIRLKIIRLNCRNFRRFKRRDDVTASETKNDDFQNKLSF